MKVRTIVDEAARSLRATMSTTVAATLTVLIGMFVLGLSIAFGTWLLSWSDHLKQQLVVKVFFHQGTHISQVVAVKDRLDASPAGEEGDVHVCQRGSQGDGAAVPGLQEDRPSEQPARAQADRLSQGRRPDGGDREHAEPAAAVRGHREVRAQDRERSTAVRACDRDHLRRRGGGAAPGGDPHDRQHDPAVDLRAAAGDRGDEARRRVELVRAGAVHGRRASRAGYSARWRPSSCS